MSSWRHRTVTVTASAAVNWSTSWRAVSLLRWPVFGVLVLAFMFGPYLLAAKIVAWMFPPWWVLADDDKVEWATWLLALPIWGLGWWGTTMLTRSRWGAWLR